MTMKAKDFILATKLLQNEKNGDKYTLEELERIFGISCNPYWSILKKNLDRNYQNTLNAIVECQNQTEQFQSKVDNVLKSKKVKTIGRFVSIKITDGIATRHEYVHNRNITDSVKTLIVDVSGKRTKYTECTE